MSYLSPSHPTMRTPFTPTANTLTCRLRQDGDGGRNAAPLPVVPIDVKPVADNGDGTYAQSFTVPALPAPADDADASAAAAAAGQEGRTLFLSVRIMGRPLRGSPFSVAVVDSDPSITGGGCTKQTETRKAERN